MSNRDALLDGIRDEVREAVLEGDAQGCSSADGIADAVYEIVRVRLRDVRPNHPDDGYAYEGCNGPGCRLARAAGVRPPDAGLDVERLARALMTAVRAERAPIGGRGDGWPAYYERGLPATVLNVDLLAKAIAREYAALAVKEPRA